MTNNSIPYRPVGQRAIARSTATVFGVAFFAISLMFGMTTPVHATPSPQGGPTRARVAAIEMTVPAWQDDFESLLVSEFWSEDASDVSERFFEDGAYQIAVNAADTVAWETAGDLAYEDVLIAVDALAVAGSADNEFGIVFRHTDDENFYVYAISSDGYYSLTRLVEGEWETLIAWEKTDAIDQAEGAWNHMELLTEAGTTSLLVNGEVLNTFEDDDSYVGGVGVVAGTFDQEGVQIAFDDFKVWDTQNLFVLEPAPTVTRTPAATEVAFDLTEELAGQLEAIRAGKPLRHDDFRTRVAAWSSDSGEKSSRFVQRGELHIRVDVPEMVSWGGPDDAEDVGDFLLEVEATHVSGPLDNGMGVIFRRVDNTFYYYKISSDGYYGLDKYNDGRWESLIDWTPSAVLDTGEHSHNLMGVLASGGTLTVLANDMALASIEDDSFASGDFALAAETNTEGGVEVAFDDLSIWQVTQPKSTATPTVRSRATATPTVRSRATATPSPSADVGELLDSIRSAAPTFSDEFRRTNSGWDTTDAEQTSISYADGALFFQMKQENWLAWSRNDRINQLAPVDFLLEVDAQHLNGPTNVGFGLIFGYTDPSNYYRFFVTQNGYYALQKFVDGVGTDLASWAQTPAFITEVQSVNRLGLLIQGEVITLMANDQVLTQVKDPAMITGTLGLIAASADVPGLEVAFDNVELWQLDND